MTEFRVYTLPATQGSTRAYVRGGKAVVTHDNPAKVRATRHDIAAAARAAWGDRPCLVDCPVTLTLTVYLPKPKSVKRELPYVRPDLDKLERLIMDALTGICYRDDAQVTDKHSRKRYAVMPGIEIGVGEVPPHAPSDACQSE